MMLNNGCSIITMQCGGCQAILQATIHTKSEVNTVTNSITKAITNTYSTSNIKDINYRGFQSFLYSISSTWSLN